jgi:predicted DNA-binding transcriptional regulator AlpA
MFKNQNKEFEGKVLRINTLLTAKQVAEILNISPSKTYHWMQIGEILKVRT